MRITERRIGDITPYDKNPRNNDEAVQYVANSIQEFGFKVPIIVDAAGVIVAGHTRLKAAERLGLETVPVIVADDLTPEQVRAYRLADNKTAEMASWDWKLLEEELAALADSDMELFGFDDYIQIEDIDPAEFDDQEGEGEGAEPITKPGDLWIMGEHRLLCGDASNPAHIRELIDGRTVDLLLTDPPYNVDYTGKTDEALKIDNDRMTTASFVKFIKDTLTPIYSELKPGGAFYIWYASMQTRAAFEAMEVLGAEPRQNLIWIKQHFTMGRQDYQWLHEPCIYGWKDGAAHYFIDDRTQNNIHDPKVPHYASMTKAELIEHAKDLQDRLEAGTDVLREDRPTASVEHPTMKPLALFERLIRNSTRPGETVADIFLGSGTTILAAERSGRRALGMEIDPVYVDASVRRWEGMTGNTATRKPAGGPQ